MSSDDSEPTKWIVNSVKSLGLPTVFLGIITYMIWVSGGWAAENVVMPLFRKQMSFIDEASAMTKQMTETTKQIETMIKEQSKDTGNAVNEVVKNREAVVANRQIFQTTADEQSAILKRIAADSELNAKSNAEQISVLKKIEENTSGKQE
ncbi:MAG TPA: hypothetical protein PLR25_19880 [Planctomycetaceae bacterium]|nr:hypothetical protein [Planctomycetaceae bacterium]